MSSKKTVEAADAGAVASEMAKASAGMAKHYRDKTHMQPADAADHCKLDGEYLTHLLNKPPDQVSWYDLSLLAEHDPEAKQIACEWRSN